MPLRPILECLGAFAGGAFIALLVSIALLAVVKVPGPPDQQVGFEMEVVFCACPMMTLFFGTLRIITYRRLRKRSIDE